MLNMDLKLVTLPGPSLCLEADLNRRAPLTTLSHNFQLSSAKENFSRRLVDREQRSQGIYPSDLPKPSKGLAVDVPYQKLQLLLLLSLSLPWLQLSAGSSNPLP